MKVNKKILIEIIILILPVIILFSLTPVLPEKVPLQWSFRGNEFIVTRSIDRKFAFLLGTIPFVLYKLIRTKYGRR
jgi:hypothetical protein